MPKWKKHDTQFRTEDDVFISFKHHQEDEAVIAAHNADIDALTAERDELQRRIAEVVVKISEAVVSDDDCVCSMLCHSAITAIAEGRDNG